MKEFKHRLPTYFEANIENQGPYNIEYLIPKTRGDVLDIINFYMYLNGEDLSTGIRISEHHLSGNCGGSMSVMDNDFEWYKVFEHCGLPSDRYINFDEKVGDVITEILNKIKERDKK